MAQALGWGATDRPVPTVCAGGGPGGGPEPFPSGSRKALTASRNRGRWKQPSSDPGKQGQPWVLRSNSMAHATVRRADEPAGTLFFGHRANECLWVPGSPDPQDPAASSAEAGGRPEGIRITAREAGILQSFPAGYPWQGTKSAQFQQIGNAVPPLMAAHLLAPHLGARVRQDDFGLAA